MRDDAIYAKKLEEQEAAREALCRRCGVCCGVGGSDPCGNLVEVSDGRYDCAAYAGRLGPQKTRSGHIFTCVTMRDIHKHGVFYPDCAYTI
jgi:hypothetical protein